MHVYIMRHGIAVDVGEEGITRDADRPLSSEGCRKTEEVAQALAAMNIRLDIVGASPLVRAEKTARIVADAAERPPERMECECLQPGGDAAGVTTWLQGLKAESVLLVGHMPDLAAFASHLLVKHDGVDLLFKKAAVCCIAFDGRPAPGRGRLEWLMQPGHLRLIARAMR